MGFLRPDSTTTNGGTWTGSHLDIDETSASDTDFVYGADGGNNTVTFGMSNPGTPNPAATGTAVVRIRLAEIDGGVLAGTFNGNANPLTVTINDSGGQLATTTFSPTTWQTFTTLTFEHTAVTDWDTVEVVLADNNHGGPGGDRRGGGVSWLEIEYVDGAISITPAEASHSHTADSPTIATDYSVTPNDGTHSHVADQPAITVPVFPNDATHSHVADPAPVGIEKVRVYWAEIILPEEQGVITLAIDDGTHSHTADSPTIDTNSVIVPGDSTHAHTAGSPTVDSSATVFPADSTHAHTADSPVVDNAQNSVTVDDATHATSSDNPTVSSSASIVVASADHVHTVDSPTVDSSAGLAINGVVHSHTADQPTITFIPLLAIDDGAHSHTADQPTISSQATITINSADHVHTADQITITPKDVQRIRADADVTDAAWLASTGNDLFAMVDEALADDGDYIYTQTDNSVCEISLATGNDPQTDDEHSFYIRMRGDGTSDLRVTIKQGATTIAQWTEVDPPATETTYRYDLTTGEAALITDYSALSVTLEVLP